MGNLCGTPEGTSNDPMNLTLEAAELNQSNRSKEAINKAKKSVNVINTAREMNKGRYKVPSKHPSAPRPK